MIRIAVRECLVLLTGVLLACAVYLVLGDAGREFGALVAAILGPIAFCLARAAMVRPPPPCLSWMRRIACQLIVSLAIAMLLVFEMATQLFLGAADVPWAAWGVVAGIGLLYVVLFCLAQLLGFDARPSRFGRTGSVQVVSCGHDGTDCEHG